MNKIRVLIADDHPLMRDALRMTIEDLSDMELIGEAANGQEAIEQYERLRPDVIVMDLLMPVADGLAAIRSIAGRHPDAHILALTSVHDEARIIAAIQAGATGYVLKDTQRDQLLFAIREVNRGNAFFSPTAASLVVNHLRRPRQLDVADLPTREPLTEREREVLHMLQQGVSNHEIAAALNLSDSTVRTHIHHLLDKLGMHSRLEIVLHAQRQVVA